MAKFRAPNKEKHFPRPPAEFGTVHIDSKGTYSDAIYTLFQIREKLEWHEVEKSGKRGTKF